MKKNYIDFFEDYYFGNLTEGEIVAFKQRLNTDADFKKAFRKYQLTVKLAKLRKPETIVSRKNIVPPVIKISDTLKEKEAIKVVPIYRRRLFQIVASVAATIVLVFVGISYFSSSFDGKQLYAKLDIKSLNKARATELLENRPRGYANDSRRFFYEGIDHFRSDRFKEAIVSLNAYLKQNTTTVQDTSFYYLGESHRLEGNCSMALEAIHKVNDKSDLFNSKQMSLLLCNLQAGEYENAKQAARHILSSQDTTFNNSANLLLEKLK